MKDSDIQVSVILPAYNEEKAIVPVIADIKAALQGKGFLYEILVVDDASTDQTPFLAKKQGARVICRPQRGGAGAARKTGILHARGNIIVMIDADGSYDAQDIPSLLEYFPFYDQVNGARDSEKGTTPRLRKIIKTILGRLSSFLAGVHIPDINTGLKAFKRDIMLHYLWVIPDGFSCVTSMTLAFICNGHNVKYIPTKYHSRIGKSKFHPIFDTWQFILTIMRLSLCFRPIRSGAIIFLFLFSIGTLKSLYTFMNHGFLVASDIILLLSSLFFLAIGILGELLIGLNRSSVWYHLGTSIDPAELDLSTEMPEGEHLRSAN